MFIRLAVVVSQNFKSNHFSEHVTNVHICSKISGKIHRKFELIAVQVHPRSSTLVLIESACDFLLVANSNCDRISYRLRDIDAFCSKQLVFPTPPLFEVR